MNATTIPAPSPPPATASHLAARAHSSIADRATRAFSPDALLAGLRYFTGGKVDLRASDDPLAIDAVVRGKIARDVKLRASDDGAKIAVACSCGPDASEMTSCRHLWAALLAIDKAGAFAPLRERRGSIALVPLGADEAIPAPAASSSASSASSSSSSAPRPAPKTGIKNITKKPKSRFGKMPRPTAPAEVMAPSSTPAPAPTAPAVPAKTARATKPAPAKTARATKPGERPKGAKAAGRRKK